MARGRDWLDRFRPAGSPGIAARPGVPAEVSEQDKATTAIFALLEPVERECDRILAEARREAQRRRDEAGAAADGLVANAERQAPQVRAEAFSRVSADQGKGEEEAPLAASAQLRASAQERLPAVLEAVHAQFLDLVATVSGVELGAPAAGGAGVAR